MNELSVVLARLAEKIGLKVEQVGPEMVANLVLRAWLGLVALWGVCVMLGAAASAFGYLCYRAECKNEHGKSEIYMTMGIVASLGFVLFLGIAVGFTCVDGIPVIARPEASLLYDLLKSLGR